MERKDVLDISNVWNTCEKKHQTQQVVVVMVHRQRQNKHKTNVYWCQYDFPKMMFQACIVILVSKVIKKWSVLLTRRIKKHPPLNPQSHPRNASNSLSTNRVRQRNPLGGEECVDRLCGSAVVNKKNKKQRKHKNSLHQYPVPKVSMQFVLSDVSNDLKRSHVQ